jgi:hypothetical protein
MSGTEGDIERLAKSRYLLEIYGEASRLHQHLLIEDDTDLTQTRDHICKLLQRLEADATFWSALINFTATHNTQVEQIVRSLADGSLPELEYRLLVENGMDEISARGLVSDLQLAGRLWLQTKTGESIENLRKRLAALREELCAAQVAELSQGTESAKLAKSANVATPTKLSRGRQFWRFAWSSRRAVLFLGGGAFVVANAIGMTIQHVDHQSGTNSIDAGKAIMFGSST